MANLGFTGVIAGPGMGYSSNITDMEIAHFGGGTYLYSTSGIGGGAMVFSMAESSAPTLIAQHGYSYSEMSSPSAQISFLNYAGQSNFVAFGHYDWTLDGISVGPNGAFDATTTLTWGAGGVGNLSAMTSAEINGITHVFGANATSNGFNHYTVDATSTLTLQNSYSSDDGNAAADIVDLHTVQNSGGTFLIAACQSDNAIKSYRLDPTGNPQGVTTLAAGQFLPVSTPTAIATGQVDGQQYVVLASAGSSSLTVLTILDDGTLRPVDHVIDNTMTRFSDVTELASIQIGDRMYIVAGGADDGLSLFTIAPNGNLILLDTFTDTNATSLQNISALAAEYVDGIIRVFATSETETGITSFEVDVGDVALTHKGASTGDIVTGTAGNDIIDGGMGNDTILGNGGDDILLDGTGLDSLTGGTGADVFVLIADDMVDTITDFQPGIDRIDLSSHYMLYDASQIDVQSTSWGATLIYRNEVLHVYNSGGRPLNHTHFTTSDMLSLDRPPSGFLHIPETLNGTENNDVLQGNEGTETLNGYEGDDLMLMSAGADAFNGGAGNDTVSYATATESASVDLQSNQSSGAAVGDLYYSIENLTGTAFDDTLGGNGSANTLFGGVGNDRLKGYGGDDTLDGGDGDDILSGGAGADRLTGGGGRDQVSYTSSTTAVQVSLSTGVTSGGALGDVLTGIEDLVGSAHGDLLDGDIGANVISGGAGNDVITGNGGNDTLNGGLGDDQIIGGPENDNIFGGVGNDILEGGEGADTIIGGTGRDTASFRRANAGVTINLNLGTTAGAATGDVLVSVEDIFGSDFNDVLSGDDDANLLRGEAGDDVLHGNDGNDWLVGSAGQDRLLGGAGHDQLEGGNGQDILDGGNGNDTLYGESGDDHFLHSLGSDHFSGGTGIDIVDYSSSTWRAYVNLISRSGAYAAQGDSFHSIEVVIGGKGNDDFTGGLGDDKLVGNGGNDLLKGFDGNDVLYGDSGHDFLLGGAGHDVLYGGTQSDTLWGQSGNDTLDGGPGGDLLDGGAGRDTVSYASFSQAVGVDLSNNYTWGAAAHDRISSFENITGSSSGDQLYGDGTANAIFGGAGEDRLYGRGGPDMLFGQDGNDIMLAGPGAELFAGGRGSDTVIMTWNTAPAHVYLNLGTGAGSMAGDRFHSVEGLHGSRYNDIFVGDGAANTFFGSWGNDILRGRGGNDILVGEGGGDWLFGGEGNDYLSGGHGTDRIFGGSEDDVMVGGAGADHFYYDDGADRIMDFDPQNEKIFVGRSLSSAQFPSSDEIFSYGTITDGGAVFDFGDNDTLFIDGITSFDPLEGVLLWI